jgi:hypothetical protein
MQGKLAPVGLMFNRFTEYTVNTHLLVGYDDLPAFQTQSKLFSNAAHNGDVLGLYVGTGLQTSPDRKHIHIVRSDVIAVAEVLAQFLADLVSKLCLVQFVQDHLPG